MDHSESIDLIIAGLFKDHGVDDSFPSVEGMACSKTEIDNSQYRLTNKDLFILEGRLAWGCGFGIIGKLDEESFVVTEVSSRGRCSGGLTPCLNFPLEFFRRDMGWD